jgi:hypothetical protein
MARRKSRKIAPNLPKEALDRARRQIEGEDVDAVDETADEIAEAEDSTPEAAPEPEPEAQDVSPVAARTGAGSREARRRRREDRPRRRSQPGMVQYSQRRKDTLDRQTMEDMLANPTKIVTEQELRQEYAHVLGDLRNMGLLALVLMVVLVALGQFI